ncbi:MAG: methyl-accepting chemotaxis protein [Desulfovibrio sp.]
MGFNDIRLKPKLLIVFIALGLIPVVVAGWWSVHSSSQALMTKSYEQLEAVRGIKGSQIEAFFQERLGDTRVLARDPYIVEAYEALSKAFYDGGGVKSGAFRGMNNEVFTATDAYKDAHAKYFPYLKYYLEQYGYYDIFMLSPEKGDVIFTVTKEADFGIQSNVVDSSLTDVWKIAAQQGRVALSDTRRYAPSGGVPAQFVAAPVMHDGKLVGVVATQISLAAVNVIMQERDGMGETGETYLVGPDLLMRSDSYLDPEGHSVLASFQGSVDKNGVRTEAAESALRGETNAKIIMDYNGNPVLSAYMPLKVGDTTWALLAEIDEAEVLIPIMEIQRSILIIAVVAFIFIVLIAILVANSITNPLAKGVAFAKELSVGNLRAKLTVQQHDEAGQLAAAMQNMAQSLTKTVHSVQSTTEGVAFGCNELSSTSQALSEGATEQAASIEEVSSSMEEMAANIKQNADNARQTGDIAAKVSDEAESSGQEVSKTVEAMRSIAEKISIIEEIARQTNLLALNAAIEAARAGEHGKGFAVVAAEVRKLAERSGIAASEISELSAGSVEMAEHAGERLMGIMPDIKKTADLIQEISAASSEQDDGARQINNAIQQLDGVIQQNATASEEVAATASELTAQAATLKSIMEFFKVDSRGNSTAQVQARTATPAVGSSSTHQSSGALPKGAEVHMDDDFEQF